MTSRLLVLPCLAVLAASACNKEDAQVQEHRKKAAALFKAEKFAEAGAEYEAALKLDKKADVKGYEKAAFAYMKGGDYEKAAEMLLQTLPLRTDDAGRIETYKNVAGMYLQQAHDAAKAEEYFGKVMELDHKDTSALGWLAEIAKERGGAGMGGGELKTDQLDLALKRYDELIKLEPENPAHWVNERIVYIKYAEHFASAKKQAESDAEANKDDKETAADFRAEAEKDQARYDELKAKVDEASKKIGELNKAARGKK